MPDEKELEGKNDDDKEGDEEEKDVGELMDADFDFGNEFKDQLIPLALEYYLEVIEAEEEDEDGCDSDEDGHHHHHHHHGGKDKDSDEEPK